MNSRLCSENRAHCKPFLSPALRGRGRRVQLTDGFREVRSHASRGLAGTDAWPHSLQRVPFPAPWPQRQGVSGEAPSVRAGWAATQGCTSLSGPRPHSRTGSEGDRSPSSAFQDRDFLENEQFFLETLKKASYNVTSHSA